MLKREAGHSESLYVKRVWRFYFVFYVLRRFNGVMADLYLKYDKGARIGLYDVTGLYQIGLKIENMK